MSLFTTVEKSFEQMKKLESSVNSGIEIAENIIEELKSITDPNITDESDERFEDVKKSMLQCIEFDRELKVYTEAIALLKRNLKDTNDYDNLEIMLEENLNEVHLKTNSDVSSDRRYQNLIKNIAGWQRSANSESLVLNDSDADLLLTQQTIITTCPISRQEMVEPVKNKLCNHTYEKANILTLIKQRKGKAICPIPGCKNRMPVRTDDLVLNYEVKNHILKQKHSI